MPCADLRVWRRRGSGPLLASWRPSTRRGLVESDMGSSRVGSFEVGHYPNGAIGEIATTMHGIRKSKMAASNISAFTDSG